MHIETNKTTQSSLGVFAFLMEAGEKPEIGGVQRSGSTWARELAVPSCSGWFSASLSNSNPAEF